MIFIKLGGSLITNKQKPKSFRVETMNRLSNEIQSAHAQRPDLQLLIGHGSGSFGHFEAKTYNTINGVYTYEQWMGFSKVANAAAELNYLVTNSLQQAGVPVFRIQPSASAIAGDGKIIEMSLVPLRQALAHKLVPVIYGDVAFDKTQGGTILSTETIFFYLAKYFPVAKIFLLSDVEGVYDTAGTVIPEISRKNLASTQRHLGTSAGVDVTGGMMTKVYDMLRLISIKPQTQIRIFSGEKPNVLKESLLGLQTPGTVIRS